MGRKTKEVTIGPDGDNRDNGKTFVLTEMGAIPAEKWATRAFLALARSGVQVPDDIANQGLAAVAAMGLQAFGGVAFHDAEPLLDEMIACVQIKEPGVGQGPIIRKLTPDDIEEVGTLIHLRSEVFKLHVDFSKLAALSKSLQERRAGKTADS